jgi:predicted nucleic acid-binding protein
MIHLDTNYLIGLLVKGSAQASEVDVWLAAGELLAASAIAWTEFLNGPVTPVEISRANAVLQSRIVPFGQPEAVLAAELFNKTGRRRGSTASSQRRRFWRRRKSQRLISRISRSSCRMD